MTVKLFNENLLIGTYGPFKKVDFKSCGVVHSLYGVNGDDTTLVAQTRRVDGKWTCLDSDMPATHFVIG